MDNGNIDLSYSVDAIRYLLLYQTFIVFEQTESGFDTVFWSAAPNGGCGIEKKSAYDAPPFVFAVGRLDSGYPNFHSFFSRLLMDYFLEIVNILLPVVEQVSCGRPWLLARL